MRTEDLLRDPVFQLNLLIWMAKEQPKNGYVVRPVFYQLGYDIIYIENPFSFPNDILLAIQSSSLQISQKPEPDLILGRMDNWNALYFEAKSDSFSCSSKNSKQARGHLIATGTAFSEVYKPFLSCLLCYVIPRDNQQLMSDCLKSLRVELNTAKLQTGQHSVHGLSIENDSIVYSWDDAFKSHTGAPENVVTVISELEEETDPTPLILVYTDEDCSDMNKIGFYRRVIIDQVRACVLCDLHSIGGDTFTCSVIEILMKFTDGIYQYIGRERQKSLGRLVRDNFIKGIVSHLKDKPQYNVTFEDDKLIIQWKSIEDKEAITDWLEDKRTKFDDSKPIVDVLPFFDNPESSNND